MTNGSGYIGRQIGSYRIIKELDSGAFGKLYQGQHIVFPDRPIVAIKLLHERLNTEKEHNRFLQEARFLEKLRHPHILPILDASIQNGLPYLIAEYASNGSLRHRLSRQSLSPLTLGEAITILSQIGEALHFAHQQGIVHRDLKPENILFNAKGEALLADFGIAIALERTTHVDAMGTPAYMAPEQFQGDVSKKSDQYALGCIAYELFTGRRAFEATTIFSMIYKHMGEQPIAPRQLNPQLPMPIEQAILKAMAKDRAARHADVVTFAVAVRSSGLDSGKTQEQWQQEGGVHYAARRYAEALQAFEQALTWNPYSINAYLGKIAALRMLKRYEEALALTGRALQLDPNNPALHTGRGDIFCLFQRYSEALAANERAIQLAPSYALAYSNKGDALNGLARYGEALAAYEKASQLDPALAAAFIGKGIALGMLGRYGESQHAYEQAIQLGPMDPEAYQGYGNLLYALRKYTEALAVYERALQLDGTSILAYNGKGISLRMLKRYDDALAALDQGLRLDPNDGTLYISRGDVFWKLDRYREALAASERAIQLIPNNAIAYNNKGDALYSLHRPVEALEAYERSLQVGSTFAPAHAGRGFVLRDQGRYQEALAAFEQAIQLDPNDVDAYFGKADVCKAIGDLKKAQQAYEKALRLGERDRKW